MEVTFSTLAKRVQELEKENDEMRTENRSVSELNDDLVSEKMDASPTPTAEIGKTSLCRCFQHILWFCYGPLKDNTRH